MSNFKISKPHINVTDTNTLDLSLDLEYPTHKVDTIANPSHYITLEFYFSIDLPSTTTGHGGSSSWSYNYYFTPKEYIPAVWAHIENLEAVQTAYQDLTYGPTPHILGYTGAATFGRVSHTAYSDHVEIIFYKETSAGEDLNFDFTGKTIFVRLYIFEEEAKN